MTVISKRLGAVKPSATKAMTAKARELTDGVFSMDGYVANLRDICELAERYGALVMVDDCHAIGHVGEAGRGTPALTGVNQRVDIITGTLGKSLGGAMGGFVAASQPIVDLLRQRSRPYLFSNSSLQQLRPDRLRQPKLPRKPTTAARHCLLTRSASGPVCRRPDLICCLGRRRSFP